MPTKPPFDPKVHLLNPEKFQSDRSSSSNEEPSRRDRRSSGESPITERRTLNESRKANRKKDSRKSDRKRESHRSNRRSLNEDDDAALARRMQEQILEEEMIAEESRKAQEMELMRAQNEGDKNTQEIDDEELARRLQFQECSPDTTRRHLEDRQRETGIADPLEYARSLQQQALMDIGSANPPREPRCTTSGGSRSTKSTTKSSRSNKNSRGSTSGSRKSTSGRSRGSSGDLEDPDLALARRMHEREQMGMGSMDILPDDEDSPTNCIRRKASSEGRTETSLSQADEDAALAQMMAESGESLRFIDRQNLPEVAARISRPGAHHVAFAAGMPRELANHPAAVSATVVDLQSGPRSGKSPTIAILRSRASPTSHRQRKLQPVPREEGLPEPSRAGLPSSMLDMDAINPDVASAKPKTKQRGGLLGFGKKNKVMNAAAVPAPIPPMSRILSPTPSKPKVPIVIRPPLSSKPGPVPYSIQASQLVPIPIERNAAIQKKKSVMLPTIKPQICAACKKPANAYLVALDKKFHSECFRCMGCHKVIDSTGPFAYMEDATGEKNALHRECFSELYGVKCAVCKNTIAPGPDGKVSFVKHPFFDSEQMCPSHASNPGRRCTACHRFEPEDEPFADLGDLGRVVCYSCCRTVVVDASDAEPLWNEVIDFFDKKLELPVWPDMRDIPILIVDYKALNDQMKQTGGAHVCSSATMTRGVCLTEHQSGRKVPVTAMKYNRQNQSFEVCEDAHDNGFTFFQVPDAHKVNPDSSVTCILCLSGLPKDLTASVLAHEATHAWIKLHPRYDHDNPLPPQVEEGCAQLIALLFLTDGLPPASDETPDDGGPSEEKLREYFKFSIETDKNEIYGEGYRKAAEAYSAIGIEALMAHVVLYKEFPTI